MRVIAAVFLACLVANVAAVKLELLGMEHERIAGSYIIEYHEHATSLFEDHVSNWQSHFEAQPTPLAREMGFKMIHARLTDDELAKMETFDEVKHISHDRIMTKMQTTQNNPIPSLDRIDQADGRDGSYTYLSDGAGVDIFVLDTGCDTDHVGWGNDANKCTYLADCAAPGITPACQQGLEPRDDDGHGTHVAGTSGSNAFGVAKEATIRCVRVLGSDGSGSIAGIINGINLVVDVRAQEAAQGQGRPGVINMSLGGGRSNQLNNVATAAMDSGTVVVVAAGNEAQNSQNVSPASAARIVTVGSSTRDDVVSSFSNHGQDVDIFAVGSNVQSLRANTDGTLTISGTSMASPHVAGAAAQLLSADPSRTPAEILQILTSTATPGMLTAPQGVDQGTPNLLLNVENAAFAGAANPDDLPDQASPTDAPAVTQAPVPDSARCLSTVDAITGALAVARGVMMDLFVTDNGPLQAGQAPSLQSITFYTTEQINANDGVVATIYSRVSQSYRNDGATTNENQWELNQANGQAQVAVASSAQVNIAGQQLFENVAVLPEALELVVNARNAIYLTTNLAQFDVVFANQNAPGNAGVATDDIVIVAPGRAVGNPFSNNAAENRLPVVTLCYSPIVGVQAIGTMADLNDDSTEVRLNNNLDCISNVQGDDALASVQNGIMFDLAVNDLAAADLPGVFLESFSVFLMDTMDAGAAEVYTTRNGASYEGQESDMSAWVLIGSVEDLSVGLSMGGETGMDTMDGDMAVAPERPSTPELVDFDFSLNYELNMDGSPQGFYVTFRDDQMQYYQAAQAESQTVAMNEYVSMSGGKGVAYPFGGANNDMVFDMRQFAGEACFSTGQSSGASSVAAAPVTLVVGVIASTLLFMFN